MYFEISYKCLNVNIIMFYKLVDWLNFELIELDIELM